MRPIGLLALLLTSHVALADTLFMKNGDRITGEIKEIWDDDVVIEPTYSDEFAVDLEDVAGIKTDRQFDIELWDGDEGKYTIEPATENGMVTLRSDEREVTMSLADLKHVSEVEEEFDWESWLNVNSNFSRGNTTSENNQVNGYLAFMWGEGDHRATFNLNLSRESSEGVTTRELDRLNSSYNWVFSNNWFFALNLTTERNPVAKLDQRVSLNPALGYDVFDNPGLSLNVQAGPGYSEEVIDGVSTVGSLFEWRVNYSQRFLKDDMSVFHNHQLYRNFDGRENLVFNSQSGFKYDITDDIYLNIQLNYDWDSEPADGTEAEDMSLVMGAGIEF